MSDSVTQNSKIMLRGDQGNKKSSKRRGNVLGILSPVIFALLIAGIFFVWPVEHLKQYIKNISVREILVKLNPAYSEIPEEFLPFGSVRVPDESNDSNPRVTDLSPGAYPSNDNPFCQTAGHAASGIKETELSRIPIPEGSFSVPNDTEKSSLILPETPRGVETTVKPLAKIAKGAANPETTQSRDDKAPSGKQDAQQKLAQLDSTSQTSDDSSSQNAAKQQAQKVTSQKKDTPDWEATPRSEKFQLPGSVLVKIQNYAGTSVHWDLLVILDDSQSMERQTRSWNPSRFQAALTFIQKLPSALSPSSKLAVRDFSCGSNKEKKEGVKGCPSRLLIDWTPASSKQWNQLLEKTDHGGATDPCAAAAFSVKKDFHGGSGRKPRMLIITGGAAAPCASSHVVRALENSESTKALAVDVLALGLRKKAKKGYSALPQRTGGVLMEMEKAADVDLYFNKYAKVLQTKVFEKVEIKNEKVSLSFSTNQEMSLVPGTYTVILPLVEGIEPSRRVIPNVKVSSAETTIVDVAVRKGRPIVRIDKKQ